MNGRRAGKILVLGLKHADAMAQTQGSSDTERERTPSLLSYPKVAHHVWYTCP